jgi:hypothetical protein
MKKKSTWLSGFLKLRVSLILLLLSAGALVALVGSGLFAAAKEQPATPDNSGIQFGQSYYNDVSPALRDLPAIWPPRPPKENEAEEIREANLNPKLPLPLHVDVPDPVIDHGLLGVLLPDAMPATILNFDGIPYPGVLCQCLPPDTNGAVGATQYVQIVNQGYQVFNKANGASVLGPNDISTIWSGFPGVCSSFTTTDGDPVVLYDHIANRWLISQFAGTGGNITDECIAISTTSDATGSYNRYGFHLGSNFFDYPKIAVWPDGYYMSTNTFGPGGSGFLGPQAFAFDRTKMLAGLAATFVTPGITGGSSEPSFLPSDLDGSLLPTTGVGNPFVSFPATGPPVYKVRLFHADFATPANTTFTLIGSPAAAGFTHLCAATRSCVPESGGEGLDGIGDRLMFRAAYRKFADGHEAVVSNYTVFAGGVSGVRWFELRAVTTAPSVFQESTYQPDTTWRWMGSVAMDQSGDLAVGFSASSSSIHPQIRYAGRLVTDPLNALSQGEAHLIDGAGSQVSGGGNRWGDYSAMTVDPVDDCTFWYTQEYYSTNSDNWRTRIGNFKFPTCAAAATPTPTPSPTPTATATATATATPVTTPTPTPTPVVVAMVSLPIATVDTSVTNFTQPVVTSTINAANNLIGFQGDFTYDETVVTFQSPPVSSAGLTASNWNVTGAVQPGGGPIRTLRVSAFSNDFTPLSGSGTLYNLNMTRVSSTPGASTALTWAAPPNNFIFIDTDLNIYAPGSTPPGSITIQAATINISGTVTYCSNPSLPPVPNVTLTLTGSASGSTLSDGSGNYTFSSLASGGSYTVTPTKAALAPGSPGINTIDVVASQRQFLNVGTPLTGCALTAADVNGDSSVNTIDVVAIQRFFLSQSTGIANVGKYQFNPVNRSYPGVVTNQTGQNYNALVFGDVASGFVH